ncbi:MAG: diguanylate cyclase [Coriobacteriia bacterium]|nr:diguanylate cyclase [Coriobacteriia bacterium]
MTDAKEQESNAGEGQRIKGVRIRVLNVVMVVLASFVALVFLQAVQQTNDAYNELETASNHYVACEAASNQMKEASNYLTVQVRTFAVTQDLTYLNRYFEEAVDTQRREKAIATLEENLPDGDSRKYLSASLDHSRKLMNREYYSMRLVVEAKGYIIDEKASALNDVKLRAEDAALSADEKIALATSMVYDETYADEVATIENNVTLCKQSLIEGFQGVQARNSELLHSLLFRQQVLTWLMLAVVIALIVSFIVVILWPIQHYITRIANNEPLPMVGAYELRYLAHEYNAMYEESLRSRSQLKHEAEHDFLTGLYNRGVFEKLLYAYRKESIALLLIDADYFKTVNDTLGHDGGDAMLQKLGNQLTKTFRASDFPCRIGGDEFAVIMTDIGPELRDVVLARVNSVKEGMRDTSDGLPVMTLSVGIAFSGSTGMDAEELFKHADNALYIVKEAGRDGYHFYDEQ